MRTVTTQAELIAAIGELESDILVANDIDIDTPININHTLTIAGAEGVSLFWFPTTSRRIMLTLGTNGNLTLQTLTLDADGRDGSFAQILGGTLVINDGVVMQNIVSTSAQHAVQIGNTSGAGGTFIMNGGLVTNIKTSETVFSTGGHIFMNGTAEISDNTGTGITMYKAPSTSRPTLTMSGTSMIARNITSFRPGGCAILEGDVIMGTADGDAPKIIENNSTNYLCGGVYLSDSTLTMNYDSEISNNSATDAGGVGVFNSTFNMNGKSSIKNNSVTGSGGGLVLSNGTVKLLDNALLSGNTAQSGGGIYVQQNSTISVGGTSKIIDNTAQNGGGMFVGTLADGAEIIIGDGNSSPEIGGNTATQFGGGIAISENGFVRLAGHSKIFDNVAQNGKGVYKLGKLELQDSLKILDGLFFDASTDDFALQSSEQISFAFEINGIELTSKLDKIALASANNTVFAAGDVDLPIIINALTAEAVIQLEASGYVATVNVPIAIAIRGDSYPSLAEFDRAAFLPPSEFGDGYDKILSEPHVLITLSEFEITYGNLGGATHSNPTKYTTLDLPITLTPPTDREGYEFGGWFDRDGRQMTEISEGTTGPLTLNAAWNRLKLRFDGNAPDACKVPAPITVYQNNVVIPRTIPCRRCYRFVCWNMPSSGSGKVYFPGDIIPVIGASVTLYAQWMPE